MEIATGAKLRATPHRVVNRSLDRTRLSLPFFFNPGLDQWVAAASNWQAHLLEAEEHMHRVRRPGAGDGFRFGDAEWRRKGVGQCCYRAECLG
jgi:hypothetical protein